MSCMSDGAKMGFGGMYEETGNPEVVADDVTSSEEALRCSLNEAR